MTWLRSCKPMKLGQYLALEATFLLRWATVKGQQSSAGWGEGGLGPQASPALTSWQLSERIDIHN